MNATRYIGPVLALLLIVISWMTGYANAGTAACDLGKLLIESNGAGVIIAGVLAFAFGWHCRVIDHVSRVRSWVWLSVAFGLPLLFSLKISGAYVFDLCWRIGDVSLNGRMALVSALAILAWTVRCAMMPPNKDMTEAGQAPKDLDLQCQRRWFGTEDCSVIAGVLITGLWAWLLFEKSQSFVVALVLISLFMLFPSWWLFSALFGALVALLGKDCLLGNGCYHFESILSFLSAKTSTASPEIWFPVQPSYGSIKWVYWDPDARIPGGGYQYVFLSISEAFGGIWVALTVVILAALYITIYIGLTKLNDRWIREYAKGVWFLLVVSSLANLLANLGVISVAGFGVPFLSLDWALCALGGGVLGVSLRTAREKKRVGDVS
ncbi:hypothetical protein [Propionivibrio dicarboxylicus]|uniref:Uncharacterized protein n=1 Tax=Propionivibrio dicarboxylicus TaxID=83767 RepID=A0A1G8NLF9_9RHOO|nr:hypothetical protein [Propionivibrio dicarboxylicus]SDI80836.1 hypothetical protein SAMN05660652_04070 [Propionivibrio dicarboxylicus]